MNCPFCDKEMRKQKEPQFSSLTIYNCRNNYLCINKFYAEFYNNSLRMYSFNYHKCVYKSYVQEPWSYIWDDWDHKHLISIKKFIPAQLPFTSENLIHNYNKLFNLIIFQ